MQGKEKLIGMILGILVSVGAAALGLQADAVKEGVCGIPAAQASPKPAQ